MAADTGQGATIGFETTGTIGCLQSMQLPEWTMERVDATCLEDTGFGKFIPGDITDPGEVVATTIFDAELAIPDGGTVETITITFPISNPANNTAATLVGTGFITTRSLPNMATNELMTMDMTIAFDGETGPLFTPEATV